MEYDTERLYYSHQQLHAHPPTTAAAAADGQGHDAENNNNNNNRPPAAGGGAGGAMMDDVDDEDNINMDACRRHFREFLRNYRLGLHRYVYREKLLRMHRRSNNKNAINNSNSDNYNGVGTATTTATTTILNRTVSKLEVDLAHIGEYDAAILGYLLTQPALLLPTLELAAADALDTLLYDLQQQGNNNNNGGAAGAEDGDDIYNNNHTTTTTTTTGRQHSHDIQILLKGNLQPTALRAIKSEHMNRLLQCPGIVISNTPVKHRAVHICIRCSKCNDTYSFSTTAPSSSSGGAEASGPFSGIRLPLQCRANPGPEHSCPKFPYTVVPDESMFVDQQTLKLQEAPERVPTGEMPRSVLVAVERSLVDICPPGTRVSVLCIPTLFTQASSSGNNNSKGSDGTKAVYLRVVGLVKETDAHGPAVTFSPAEEEAFSTLAQRADVYDILSRSIAPNISGAYTVDIKKALVCQLLGGSPKRLPDGMRLRGDINVLLLGDPSMAKSQFLKYISKVAPVGIYTSGKGSSAAGLTASVVRDAKGEFYLEGGAMVLADGGIVCIDEFDKMRPADRVAIHEAMEQQTISVAKAGITTVLNSRSAVLAAANPVFGRYDDFKSASENIDLMTTILSRFDLIFLVRDIREEERDRMICQHVMGVHMGATAAASGMVRGGTGSNPYQAGGGGGGLPGDGPMSGMDGNGSSSSSPEAIAEHVMSVAQSGQGNLDVTAMKKYIQYCKARCSPRLSEEAGDVLVSSYVKIRDNVRQHAIAAAAASSGGNNDTQAAIPITVRQLEALVRLSESLAKMRLDTQVQSQDVTEALRLFKVSTMAANAADENMAITAGSAGYSSVIGGGSREEMERTEAFLRSRLTLGSLVNKQRVIEEAAGQGFNAVLVSRAMGIMASRGDILERNQGRLIKRCR